MDRAMPVILADDISKGYQGDGVVTWALRGANLCVEAGEFVAVVGASGSGKSTLLNIVGALDRPTSGRISIDGKQLLELGENELAMVRNETIGFIFQFHYLLNEFSIFENALMPMNISKGGVSSCDVKWVKKLFENVGLAKHIHRRPGQLSGGQQQRAAIVRALANRPKLILADEPTGNLDSQNGALVFDLLADINSQLGMAFVLVTHDDRLARRADRIVSMEDGRIVTDYRLEDVEKESDSLRS